MPANLRHWLQAQALSESAKDTGKLSSPDVESQADTGALDKAKNSGDGYGVLTTRAGSWHLDPADDR